MNHVLPSKFIVAVLTKVLRRMSGIWCLWCLSRLHECSFGMCSNLIPSRGAHFGKSQKIGFVDLDIQVNLNKLLFLNKNNMNKWHQEKILPKLYSKSSSNKFFQVF